MNIGRKAFEYILRSIGEVKLEHIKNPGIPYTLYHINLQLEIEGDVEPLQGEYIIANNYYRIKDAYMLRLAERYGDQFIVDRAQAFFAKHIIHGIK